MLANGMTATELVDMLDGMSLAEAEIMLGKSDSWTRSALLVLVLGRAGARDRIRIFLEWFCRCDAPWPFRTPIAERIRFALRELDLIDFLEPPARSFYGSLPKVVPIWRGCERGRERGLSWTTARSIAEGFAFGKRCRNKTPTLMRAEIPKQFIFGVFVDRQEDEVAVDPKRLRRLSFEPLSQKSDWNAIPTA